MKTKIMKGKSHFTTEEIQQIVLLIEQKCKASSSEQKGIRAKIRALGFYASDFGLAGGYTVADFYRVTGAAKTPGSPPPKNVDPKILPPQRSEKPSSSISRSGSDENYILDLCDEVLGQCSVQQHRFDFLVGDAGTKLPVDAYYSNLNLVVEYRERQHTEAVKFFDRRQTVSGVGRGEQRKKYDDLRESVLPRQGIRLVILHYHEFAHSGAKRLQRVRERDLMRKKLKTLS